MIGLTDVAQRSDDVRASADRWRSPDVASARADRAVRRCGLGLRQQHHLYHQPLIAKNGTPEQGSIFCAIFGRRLGKTKPPAMLVVNKKYFSE